MRFAWLLSIPTLVVLIATSAASAGTVPSVRATHEVVATIPVGSQAAWLAFAGRTDLLYVANIFSDDVSVIDPTTRSVVDTIPLAGGSVCAHPFGVGYDKKHDVVYVACQQYSAVTAIDGKTRRPIGEPIDVGSSPFGIAYDQRNGDVYIAIAHTNEVVVLDGATRRIIDRIPVGVAPFGIAYNGKRGLLYVANSQSNDVSVIDGATNKVVSTIAVAASPMGVAYDPRHDTVYVTNFGASAVTAIDARTNKPIAEVAVGGGPFGIAFNERDGDVYVASFFAGTVDVIDTATNLMVESVPLGSGAVGVAADPRSGDVYVTHGDAVSVLAERKGPRLLRVTPRVLNFGAQSVNTTQTKFISVRNVRDHPLLVSVTTVHVPDDFAGGGGLPGATSLARPILARA